MNQAFVHIHLRVFWVENCTELEDKTPPSPGLLTITMRFVSGSKRMHDAGPWGGLADARMVEPGRINRMLPEIESSSKTHKKYPWLAQEL